MISSTRRAGMLALAAVLGTAMAACADDPQVSTVRSEQGGGATVEPTTVEVSVPDTVVVTEPDVTLPEMTLPTVPTTPPEESVPDDTTDDTTDVDDDGPSVEVPSELAPLGDPATSSFSWEDPYSPDDRVDAYLAGLVELPVDDYEERAGRCFAAVGSFTATSISSGLVVSSFRTPPIYGAVGGTVAETGFGSCVSTDIEAAGFDWTYDISTTPGTTYRFYEPFFVEGADATLDAVVVGDVYFGEDLRFFAPTLSDSLPTIDVVTGPSVAEGQTLTPVGDPSLSTFTYASEYSPDDQWSGTVAGLVELPLSSYAEIPGRCFALLGTLVPTAISEGELSAPFTTPELALIADGRELESGFMNCDDSGFEPAGYGWYLDAEVPIGESYPFWVSFFTPSTAEPRLEAVVLGPTTDDDHLLFSPTVLPAIPPVG